MKTASFKLYRSNNNKTYNDNDNVVLKFVISTCTELHEGVAYKVNPNAVVCHVPNCRWNEISIYSYFPYIYSRTS